MKLLLLFLGCVWLAAGACVELDGDKILARDMARIVPAFSAADGEQVLSFAPVPGTARTFSPGEIQRAANRLGIAIGNPVPGPVCFERAAAALRLEDIRAALAAALALPGADIEVLDYPHAHFPPGRLEFGRSGLSKPPEGVPGSPVLWRGRLVYNSGRSIPVWATVRILVESEIVVAVQDIPPGRVLNAADGVLTRVRQFPFGEGCLSSTDQLEGKISRQSIRAGKPICSSMLEIQKDVAPGMMVQVSATSGEASIRFEARAQTGGRTGDTILVRNPANGHTFQAVIAGKGKVEVNAPSGS